MAERRFLVAVPRSGPSYGGNADRLGAQAGGRAQRPPAPAGQAGLPGEGCEPGRPLQSALECALHVRAWPFRLALLPPPGLQGAPAGPGLGGRALRQDRGRRYPRGGSGPAGLDEAHAASEGWRRDSSGSRGRVLAQAGGPGVGAGAQEHLARGSGKAPVRRGPPRRGRDTCARCAGGIGGAAKARLGAARRCKRLSQRQPAGRAGSLGGARPRTPPPRRDFPPAGFRLRLPGRRGAGGSCFGPLWAWNKETS